MRRIPLVLPALDVRSHAVQPTRLRWLKDGECKAREPVACSWLGIYSRSARTPLFADEPRDLQVVLATPAAGRFHRNPELPDDGGWTELLPNRTSAWRPGSVVGWLESDELGAEEPQELLALFLAGRRVLEMAEVRDVILSGWHSRLRAWWSPPGDPGALSTLTSLGICELRGVMLGERRGFFDWFESSPGPVQIIHFPDHITVPAAPLTISRLELSPSQRAAIMADFATWWQRFFVSAVEQPETAPWPSSSLVDFNAAAHLLSSATRGGQLGRAAVLSDGVVKKYAGRHALLLSLHSESAIVARHHRLGYILAFHSHRIPDVGSAFKTWLRSEFRPVVRSVAQVKQDLTALVSLARARGVTDILVLNEMASSSDPTVDCLAPFDQPTFDGLVRKRELNLMLYELARETDLSIVDVDDLGTQLGGSHFLTDMIHQDRAMEAAVRDEILRILRGRGVPGF